MKRITPSLAIAIAFLMSACGVMPPVSFTVPNVQASKNKINAELKSLTVNNASPSEAKGLILAINPNVQDQWKNSLTEALNKKSIFKDDAIRKVNIAVKILKISGEGGINSEIDVIALYEIIDRNDGSIIFSKEISTKGTYPLDFNPGIVRVTHSLNNGVRENISEFLTSIENLELGLPQK